MCVETDHIKPETCLNLTTGPKYSRRILKRILFICWNVELLSTNILRAVLTHITASGLIQTYIYI